jgi:hypothetical protein
MSCTSNHNRQFSQLRRFQLNISWPHLATTRGAPGLVVAEPNHRSSGGLILKKRPIKPKTRATAENIGFLYPALIHTLCGYYAFRFMFSCDLFLLSISNNYVPYI